MEVFVIATANMPAPWEHPFMARRAAKYIMRLPGLLGIHLMYPRGSLLVFGTRPHAEKAMQRMQRDHVPVSDRMMRGTAERDAEGNLEKLTVTEPVDGWTEEEKREIEENRWRREKA